MGNLVAEKSRGKCCKGGNGDVMPNTKLVSRPVDAISLILIITRIVFYEKSSSLVERYVSLSKNTESNET